MVFRNGPHGAVCLLLYFYYSVTVVKAGSKGNGKASRTYQDGCAGITGGDLNNKWRFSKQNGWRILSEYACNRSCLGNGLSEILSWCFLGVGNGWPDQGKTASSIPRLWCPGCSRWGRDAEKPHGDTARFSRCRCVWPLFPERWSGWGYHVVLVCSFCFSLWSRMVKVVPLPSSLMTPTSPPCAWTMCLTMASPRPVPPSLRLRAASLR